VRRSLRVAAGVVAALVGGASTAASQTVSFTESEVSVVEAEGYVRLLLSISEPADPYASVFWFTEAGTADGGDFGAGSGIREWTDGLGGKRVLDIDIVNDAEVEGPETFTVTIAPGDGAVVGEPSSVTVTILDDDGEGEGSVWIDPEHSVVYPDTGERWFVVEEGQGLTVKLVSAVSATLPVVLSVTLPDWAYADTVMVSSSGHTAIIGLPEIPGAMAAGHVRVTPQTGRGVRPQEIRLLSVDDEAYEQSCLVCSFFLLYVLSGDFECPDCRAAEFCAGSYTGRRGGRTGAGSAAGASARAGAGVDAGTGRGGLPEPPVDVIRRYRDDVLLPDAGLAHYVDLFETYQADAFSAILGQPTTFLRVGAGLEAWLPAITASANGNPELAFISPAMEDLLNEVLDLLQASASPELAGVIATERARLGLDAIAGQSMEAFHAAVSAVGSTPVRTGSWGSLKDRYR